MHRYVHIHIYIYMFYAINTIIYMHMYMHMHIICYIYHHIYTPYHPQVSLSSYVSYFFYHLNFLSSISFYILFFLSLSASFSPLLPLILFHLSLLLLFLHLPLYHPSFFLFPSLLSQLGLDAELQTHVQKDTVLLLMWLMKLVPWALKGDSQSWESECMRASQLWTELRGLGEGGWEWLGGDSSQMLVK